ncbi:NfeD family protein [Sphingomonas sp. LaA6.9]|uniref:NfeD family protein n=1 Tax=Sphingomonas sp. LaA6.9 TaxID=2919914 RepID=UPI001F4FB0A0|nr:NfeD family protein [Sphingomonas sp. LaA6.9]MCJ8157349.1 NfeD family protein [Sphingomonas sp. LaA6.9]
MLDVLPLEAHWIWMILAAILGTAEILLPGFFLIWIGLAALLTGVITLLTGIGEPAQFAVFATLAIAAVYAGRRWFALNPIETSDPLLNDRTARLIGEIVTVVEAIDGGTGRVRVADGVWTAIGADAAVGTRLRVTGAANGRLTVEPLP